MKKILYLILCIPLILIMLTGCNFTTSLTYAVGTGDKITVSLSGDTYSLKGINLPFTITYKNKDKVLVSGTFIPKSDYTDIKNTVLNQYVGDNTYSDINTGVKNGNEYLYYNTKNDTKVYYTYYIYLEGTNTVVKLESCADIETKVMSDIFNSLTYVVEEPETDPTTTSTTTTEVTTTTESK